MLKQAGITTLEAILSMAIVTSVSAYTLAMAQEVEDSVDAYQQNIDIQSMRDKIYAKPKS